MAPQTTTSQHISILYTHSVLSAQRILSISSAGHKQRKQTKRDSFSVGIRDYVSECVCKIQKLQHLSLKINNGLNTKYTYAIYRRYHHGDKHQVPRHAVNTQKALFPNLERIKNYRKGNIVGQRLHARVV